MEVRRVLNYIWQEIGRRVTGGRNETTVRQAHRGQKRGLGGRRTKNKAYIKIPYHNPFFCMLTERIV